LLCQRCGRVFDPDADDGNEEIITARCPDCGGTAIEVSPSGEFVCLKCGLIFVPGEPVNARRQKLNLKAFAVELVARARKLAKTKKGKPKSEPPNRTVKEIYAARAEARHATAKPEGTRK
jgi:predicted  nucleic acid-binding Zn-ribbon protein